MASEKRREPRCDVRIRASFRNGTGTPTRVRLTNLSAHGCRFASPRKRMGPGAFLTLTFGSFDFINARVSWRNGDEHGITFLEPLHPAVLEHVCAVLSKHPNTPEAPAGASG